MADGDLDQEQEQKKEPAQLSRGGWIAEHGFSAMMEFVRAVEKALHDHNGNVPDTEKQRLRAQWRALGPLDSIGAQQRLGSKLNSAIN